MYCNPLPQAAIRSELQLRTQEALNSMDPVDREVLALRHFEELSISDFAASLVCRRPPPATATSGLSSGSRRSSPAGPRPELLRPVNQLARGSGRQVVASGAASSSVPPPAAGHSRPEGVHR
jgi:hypothetical protein